MNPQREVAVETFLAGYNCAQSVLYAYAPELGLDSETALRVATGLGAGLALRGEVCGAVIGGIMALGLKYGRGENQGHAAAEETYRKSRELMTRFEQKHGSCLCRVLLEGCDLSTAEGKRHYREHDLLHQTCVKCVETVGEILAGMLDAPAAQAPAANKQR